MSSLRPSDKRFLEDFLEMSAEQVLDFDKRRFADLFDDLFQLDIYCDKYSVFGSSDAARLRAFWKLENDENVGELLGELAEFWLHLQPDYIVDGGYNDYQKVLEIAAKLKSQPSSGDRMSVSQTEEPGLEILEELGRGGFGIVHRVRVDNEIFARKSFEPLGSNISRSSQEKLKERFCREILAQQTLPDGIAIPIVDCSMDDDPPWFLMPVADLTFDKQIKEDKSTGTILPILLEVLSALEKLHGLGRVHRDLAPSNIFKLKGRWLLGDLGLISPGDSDLDITSSFSTWGRLDYSAPELSQQYKKATARADIYSFGCILHEVFVAKPRVPYHTHSGPGHIGNVIKKCTAFQPRDRYQNVAEVRQALETAIRTDSPGSGKEAISEASEVLENALLGSPENPEKLLNVLSASAPEGYEQSYANLIQNVPTSCIEKFFSISIEKATIFLVHFCDLVDEKSARRAFGFEFCDELGGKLQTLYHLADTTSRVRVVRTSAHLGASHNRFSVQAKVRLMAGPEIEDELAVLIALDLDESLIENLRACTLNGDLSAYHNIIANSIRRAAEMNSER